MKKEESSINVNLYVERTLKKLAIRRRAAWHSADMLNPDPEGPFLGKDLKWYEVIFPEGRYTSYQTAMGWCVQPRKAGEGFPGFLTGKTPASKEDILKLIKSDLLKTNRNIHEVIAGDQIPAELPEAAKNTCWVKVYFSEDDWGTFHIARKDEASGRWIHKLPWNNYVTVVMDNLEFGDITDILMERDPKFKKAMKGVTKEAFANYARLLGVRLKGVRNSKWQGDDSAAFRAYNPYEDKIVEYLPEWAIRIDI